MVFEVLGHNLLKLITKSDYSGIPLENVRIIVKQVNIRNFFYQPSYFLIKRFWKHFIIYILNVILFILI